MKACHIGPKFVLSIGNTDVYAGNVFDVMDSAGQWDLYIRLLDNDHDREIMDRPSVRFTRGAEEIFPKAMSNEDHTPILDVDWADFHIPSLAKAWWVVLWETLHDFRKDERRMKVVVFCMGGHGRTGTALSILAGLNARNAQPDIKKFDPVKYIRDRYCKDAVESYSQIQYIKQVTGLEFHSQQRNVLQQTTGKRKYIHGEIVSFSGIEYIFNGKRKKFELYKKNLVSTKTDTQDYNGPAHRTEVI